jgi:hypothetical protein
MAALTRTAAARIAAQLVSTTILLLPAIWNGFPLLEYDTGGYLARWFEGVLVVSRSTTYGLFLAAGWPLDFWPIVILQAAVAIWVVGALLKLHQFNLYPAGLLIVVAVLAVTTALPWLASELLTDIFAGLAVLVLHALAWHGDKIGSRQRAALFVFAAFAASTHSATFAVMVTLCGAAFVLWLCNRKLVPGAGIARALTATAFGAIMLLAANYVVARQVAWTPGGYGILFARMLQDGIVTRYLDDHCPDPRLRLCPYRKELPLDADEFLWDGPIFEKLGRFNGLGDEMRAIVLESLRDYPALQIKAALVATGRQLIAVGTGEGIVTDMWHTHWVIEHFTPTVAPAMHAARQQREEIHFSAINAIHEPVAWAAMAFLPALIILGFRRADFADLARLSGTIALALLANAAVCGIISNPHDRYGSRMVWIAVLAALLAAWRWLTPTRARSPVEVLR